jgi:hypothetical protein
MPSPAHTVIPICYRGDRRRRITPGSGCHEVHHFLSRFIGVHPLLKFLLSRCRDGTPNGIADGKIKDSKADEHR